MKKFDSPTIKRVKELLKSKNVKIFGSALGGLLIIISLILYIKSQATNEKKISFSVSVPASPNLSRQEIGSKPVYHRLRRDLFQKLKMFQTEISLRYFHFT